MTEHLQDPPELPLSTREALEALALRAFAARTEAQRQMPSIVVDPASPILYFGDQPAYQQSKTRVITVGLNPSLAEFPPADPFLRFPGAGQGPGRNYLNAMNAYFMTHPYDTWFRTFFSMLDGLGSHFHSSAPSIALHTDLCSPVATNPTWSRLSSEDTTLLAKLGTPLWHDLVRILRPHVILVSVARERLDDIDFQPRGEWEAIYEIVEGRKRPYTVIARRCSVTPNHESLIVWGEAANTPFGAITNTARREIGATVSAMLP
jgi:hypothetical protein